MKRFAIYEMLFLLMITSGCSAYSSDMSGTVIDAETGRPIEGAVVLVEWTKTKGIGLTHTEAYKVQEILTDKEGKFSVSGVADPFVNTPSLTIYKKDYIGWNNEFTFPGMERRHDFIWERKTTIRMIPFTKDYSRPDHVYFLHSVSHWGKLMNDAYRWEELVKESTK